MEAGLHACWASALPIGLYPWHPETSTQLRDRDLNSVSCRNCDPTGQALRFNPWGTYEEYRDWRFRGDGMNSPGFMGSSLTHIPLDGRGGGAMKTERNRLLAFMDRKGFEVLCLFEIPLATAEITNTTPGLSIFTGAPPSSPGSTSSQPGSKASDLGNQRWRGWGPTCCLAWPV